MKSLQILILVLGLLTCAISGLAANRFVRTSSAGSANGSDWNNAWSMANLNSNQGSIAAGDTVWLAGGTYTTRMLFTASGTAGSRITINRATAGDVACTSAAGWSSSFDSVVISDTSTEGMTVDASYVTISGRTNYGIKCIGRNLVGRYRTFMVGGSNVQVDSVETSGPGDVAYVAYVEGFGCYGSGHTISNVYIHGFNENITTAASSVLWVKCRIEDNYQGSGNPDIAHANLVEYMGSGHTFLNCIFKNWEVVGFEMWNGSGSLTVAGSLVLDAAQDLLWPSGTYTPNTGPIYFYNNTVVNAGAVMGRENTVVLNTASRARNNIYWNTPWYGAWRSTPGVANSGVILDRNYEFAASIGSASYPSGGNCILTGSNPFVNLAGGDYRIIATVSANLPRNKGMALDSAYATDLYGVTRGADGTWDIGAYEYGSSVASTNPVIVVSPGSQDFGSVMVGTTRDLTFTVQNIGGSTLAGTASVSVPFSILTGGTYSLGANQSQVVTIRFSPTAVGSISQAITFTGGGGATAIVSGVQVEPPVPGSLVFEAEAGIVSAPFISANGSISQVLETSVTAGGLATYSFTTTNAGDYVIQSTVNAPNESANSLYVNIDAEPQDPGMIWHIPVTAGFESRMVTWQGNGTFDNPQFVPKVFNLTAGNHHIFIRGREANMQLDRLSLVKLVPPPSNLIVVRAP